MSDFIGYWVVQLKHVIGPLHSLHSRHLFKGVTKPWLRLRGTCGSSFLNYSNNTRVRVLTGAKFHNSCLLYFGVREITVILRIRLMSFEIGYSRLVTAFCVRSLGPHACVARWQELKEVLVLSSGNSDSECSPHQGQGRKIQSTRSY